MDKLPKPKISKRMQYFVDHGIDQSPFWDICCDHGYIGIAALYSERFTEVHFVDQIPHIIERLEKLILQSPQLKSNYRYTVSSEGGEKISEIILGTAVIAGVSGRTIVKILDALIKNNWLKAHRLILSPHLDIEFFKEFCHTNLSNEGYRLKQFTEINENDRLRPIFIFDQEILIAK